MDSAFKIEEPRIRLLSSRLAVGDELLRWVCETRNIAYAEQTQALDRHPQNELPGIVAPEREVRGLEASLDLIDRRCRPGERVFGEGEEERAKTRARLDLACRSLAEPALRLWLHYGTTTPALLTRLSTIASSSLSASRLRQKFELESFDPAATGAQVKQALTGLESDLSAIGTRFLAGDSPGAADILIAGLSWMLVMPAKCGVASPSLDELPAPLRDLVVDCRNRRAGEYVTSVFDVARPRPQPTMKKPADGPTLLESLASPGVVRFGVGLLRRFAPRLNFGGTLVVSDWQGVTEVLERDNDFLIAPINQERIDAVNGRFILGMDRSPELMRQREQVYSALRDADKKPFLTTLAEQSTRILNDAVASGGKLDVVNGYARPVAGRTAAALFGIAGPTEQDLLRVIRCIFHETFLNLSGDPEIKKRGIEAGVELKAWIEEERTKRVKRGSPGDDVLGRLLASSPSDPDAARCMLAGLEVGAIDTTATVVANIVAEILGDPALKVAMTQDRNDPRRLLGWCWEALRRRPHNAGMLRQAGRDALLGGQPVKEGTRVLVLTLGAMHDPAAFDDPGQLRPDRPLDRYLHFGHGLHQCSGREFNAIQIPALVKGLLDRDVSGTPRLRTRGPFPDELVVTIRAQQRVE